MVKPNIGPKSLSWTEEERKKKRRPSGEKEKDFFVSKMFPGERQKKS